MADSLPKDVRLCLRCEEIETFCGCEKPVFEVAELITQWRRALRTIMYQTEPPERAYYTAYEALGRPTT